MDFTDTKGCVMRSAPIPMGAAWRIHLSQWVRHAKAGWGAGGGGGCDHPGQCCMHMRGITQVNDLQYPVHRTHYPAAESPPKAFYKFNPPPHDAQARGCSRFMFPGLDPGRRSPGSRNRINVLDTGRRSPHDQWGQQPNKYIHSNMLNAK